MNATPDQLTAYVAAIIGVVAAGYERFKSNKTTNKTAQDDQALSDAKRQEERANLMARMAEEYKVLYEKESAEHIRTREFWHNKASEHQNSLSNCQEKILELQSRPDLSDILGSIKSQGDISLQILAGIREILNHFIHKND